jgi:hypothetical protein
LSLVKNVEKAHSIDVISDWKVVYDENFGRIPEWSVCLRAIIKKDLENKAIEISLVSPSHV